MLDALDRFVRQAMKVAEDVGEKAGKVAGETLQEAGFIGNLLRMPEERALEELQSKMQGADERMYRMLKLTINGMIRLAQAAEANGDLSLFQKMVLRGVSQNYLPKLAMYANYVDELYKEKSSQDVANDTVQAGAQALSIAVSLQANELESTRGPSGWLPGTVSTQKSGPGQQNDASSPKQIIADFISRKRT